MKKLQIFCLIAILVFANCKKNNSNSTNINQGGNDIPQSIETALNSTDSLHQFNELFKTLSLSNTDVAGGVTVLALTNDALINPINPNNLKDYIIKGIVKPAELTDGKTLTSISGKQIKITVLNGQTFANGIMISTSTIATTNNYSIYAIAGIYNGNGARYNDPHKNEYYVEYYENGTYHSLSGRGITTWPFFSTGNFPTPVAGNCSYPSYNSYSSGPAQALVAFAAESPFWLQINRSDFTSVPIAKEYGISSSTYISAQNKNSGNCNLVINGAVFGCDLGDKDSYVRVNITEVKVDQDLGIEKRGYYKGEFDAVLYYISHAGATPEKRIITGGRFMAPMGGNETSELTGTAPTLDRYAILTTGKWYFRPLVLEANAIEPNSFPPCNLDDYIVFRKDGTCDFKDGVDVCPDTLTEIDHGNNIPWALTNNQTTIDFISGSLIWQIAQISDSALVLVGGGKLTHGN